MIKKFPHILLFFFGLSISALAQNKQLNFENKLIEHFKKHTWGNVLITADTLYQSPYKNFHVAISENRLEFDTTRIVIKNPYFSDKYEESEEEKHYTKNYPKSFSVLYESSLISLFENGKFGCFKLENFDRDTILENKLNSKKFKYHWIINSQLAGLSGRSIYLFNGNKWTKYKDSFPIRSQPLIFEDEKFLVYGDCHGEWGGTVYFFEKPTSKTFFTESTCANLVIKDANGYNVLAQLGHGGGSAEIKNIADPTKLTLAKRNEIGKKVNGEALGYTDKSNAYSKTLDFYGLQIFSTFYYHNRMLYIVNLADLTFIAEINNNKIEIVHPLYFSNLYTHRPITTRHGDYILVNLDYYGTGLRREISVLIIKGNKISKLDWNEDHSR